LQETAMSFWKIPFWWWRQTGRPRLANPSTIGEENYKGHIIRGLVMANGSG